MASKPYGLICPITTACEMLEPRWTIPILTELWDGSSKFNDIRRGIGGVSPALLSKRLKEMGEKGLIERIEDPVSGSIDYIRTEKAKELETALGELAKWAQKNVEAEVALNDASLSALMWRMRRRILKDELPNRRVVIQFHITDAEELHDTFWVLSRPEAPSEVCTSIPDYDVDLYVECEKQSLAAIMLGRSDVARELDAERLFLSGDRLLSRTMSRWLSTGDYGQLPDIAQLPQASSPQT